MTAKPLFALCLSAALLLVPAQPVHALVAPPAASNDGGSNSDAVIGLLVLGVIGLIIGSQLSQGASVTRKRNPSTSQF